MIDLLPLVAAASSVAEYPAARMIADAFATELANAAPLWPKLRPVLAQAARAIAKQTRADTFALPVEDAAALHDYANDLDGAALDLEREHARAWYDESRKLVALYGHYPSTRRAGIQGMRSAWLALNEAKRRESFGDRLRRRL